MHRHHQLTCLSLCGLALLLLACGSGGMITGSGARWACPSPEPRPWGPDGPVKEIIRSARPTSVPTGPITYDEQPVYYAIWEQEYGASASGPPFPSPTPYARIGTHFSLGQRVEIGPVHVLVNAHSGARISEPGIAANTQQLYLIELTWINRALDPIAIDYSQAVRVRAITDPAGAVVSDARWGLSAQSLRLAGIESLPATIPTGTSQVIIPILGPPGTPETVELIFAGQPGAFVAMPSATTLPGTPTATPLPPPSPSPTALPNVGLHVEQNSELHIQWSAAEWSAPGAGPCGSAGVITDWSAGEGVAWGAAVPIAGVPAPAGAARVVQIALNQIGKRYVWGAKGPETFDCSGLVAWSYAQIGLRIPSGTGGQWPGMAAITPGDLLPGDLVFFDIDQDRRVDHVGMLIGDLNRDGQWDMVHAANPQLGVRIDYGVLASSYYAPRIVGFRTARSTQG